MRAKAQRCKRLLSMFITVLNLGLSLEARRMRRRPDARHGGFRQVNMQLNSARKVISRDQHATGMVSTTRQGNTAELDGVLALPCSISLSPCTDKRFFAPRNAGM